MRIRLAAALLTLIAALLWAGAASADGPLTLEKRTDSSLTISWRWSGQPASAYDLAWRARGDDSAAAWRSVRKTAAQRRHTISRLDAGASYIIRVRPLDSHNRPLAALQGTFATSPPVAGQPPDPRLLRGFAERLTLELASSRELCTAGTLTEISWAINGGTPPYTLNIDGAAVDANADNTRINCGALPTDPLTDELIARRTKTFRASVRDSRGVTATATTTVTLTTPPYLAANTTLRYDTYDLTGAATSAGSYAFLTDADSAAKVITTYEGLRDGSAGELLIHTSDAQGASQRSLYAAVATGDLFEWRQSYDCWVRYQVTEVKPDPPDTAPRALLAVEQASYAFSGCSGAISTDAVLIAWGPLPDLGGPNLAAPVVHGPYQLVPEGWSGAVQEPRTYDYPGYSATNPIYTRDLAEARRLPYWRDPALPAGWTFSWVTVGDVSGPAYGYWAVFAAERGSLTIFGYYAGYRGHPEEASWLNGRGAFETRTIAGRPARVAYSPPGPSHFDLFPVTVWIYDPSTETEYAVLGQVKRLHEANVDAVIAIARSLFEE